MTRFTVAVSLLAALLCATSAWAQEQDGPCLSLTGDELKACLAEAVAQETPVVLPMCAMEDAADLEACKAARAEFQKLLAEATGEPCAGFTGEELETCQAAAAQPRKKKGLSKHEGTKMERIEGTGEEDE